MSREIPERVTCEVCGTAFDPRESRGWCPNSACGKWQHPAFPLSEGGSAARGTADGGVDAPTKVCPSCGKDVRADANFCKFCSHQFPDDPVERTEPEEAGLDECPDCGADLSSIPPDRLDDCPICGTNLADVLAAQSEPSITPADLDDCPACGEDLTSIPSDMRMVCPNCRVDLQEAIETHGVEDTGESEAPTPDQSGAPAGSGAAESGSETGGAATGAGVPEESDADIDTIKGIGTSYAERLAGAGVETVGDLVGADVQELSAATDISHKRIEEWIEKAPIDPADVGAAEPNRTGDAGATAGGGPADSGQQGGSQASSGQPGGQQGGRSSVGDQTESDQRGGRPSAEGAGTGGQPRQEEEQDRRQDRFETQVRPSYDAVVLEVMGQEIRARPGDTIGQEIRAAMVEGGAPDSDAVYIHREHVRVEREGDAFYFVRLGENSLKINGELVGQHERVEVSNGDVASFSEVVTADIRLE